MKILLLSLSMLFAPALWSQYYYNDILGTAESNQQMKTYIAAKVRTVSATGFDNRGAKAADFSEFHEIKENGKALKISTFRNLNKTVTYSRFDEQLRLIINADSFSVIQNFTTYQYDNAGRVIKVENTVKDSANDFNQVETHNWTYNGSGKPEKMWRIINNAAGVDSLEVRFTIDDDGNVSEERGYKRGVETNFVYYYYDEKNRLSDVVRYNKTLKKLVPDFMFEYDDNDRMIQKTTTTSDREVGYLIWRYIFNENGLKTKEALFVNDSKQFTGKIEYSYTFGQ